MRTWIALATGLAMVACSGTVGAQQTVKIGVPFEGSGDASVDGTNWKRGAELAIDEINANGGILGRRIEVTFTDTQGNPGVARATVQKMLDDDNYVVVGPVMSGECKVVMQVTRQAQVPLFCGGENAELTTQGDPWYFRTSLAQQFSLPKLADYIRDVVKAKSIIILWENDVAGTGSRDVMKREAAARGINVLADIPSENGQTDFAADVVKAKSYNADAWYIHIREADTARLLKEIRRQGVTVPLLGDTTLNSQTVIDLAGDAVNGTHAFVGLAPDAPIPSIQEFRKRFARYGENPDHNAIKGYIAVYATKYVTERIGKFDRALFARTLHGLTITTKDEPNILLDTSWDQNGDIDRDSFMVDVVNGKQNVTDIIPRSNAGAAK